MSLKTLSEKQFIISVIVFCSVCFLPFLSGVHLFDWDEINFAEAAREMILSGNYSRVQINFQPFWEKPPLFFWFQALSMKIFGINDYAARLPNALCGFLTLFSLYFWGKRIHSKRFGMLWALSYAGSVLPHLYFKSGIIDPFFNLFIFNGLMFFIAFLYSNKKLEGLLGAICITLAVLTKGHVALMISAITGFVLLFTYNKLIVNNFSRILIFIIITMCLSSIWFLQETLRNGTWFIKTFFEYQLRLLNTADAGHGGPIYYHILVLLFGCFPASFFALQYLYIKDKNIIDKGFHNMMIALFFVVLIVFSLVKSKIVHYSSMCYFPITYFSALGIIYGLEFGFKNIIRKSIQIFLIIFAGIIAIVPFLANYLTQIKFVQFANDKFTEASLKANVDWNYYLAIPAICILIINIYLLFIKWDFKKISAIFILNIFLVQSTLYAYINNIETYSQRALIEYCSMFDYRKKDYKDAHLITIGFKSYADLWYGFKRFPKEDEFSWTNNDLIYKNTKRDVYAICKINKLAETLSQTPFKLIEMKNGYCLLKKIKVE
jgi:hypothetical protein